MEATITLNYQNPKTAVAIANAVSPDNHAAPEGLTITTQQNGNSVTTTIQLNGKLPTLIATIDDLLFCACTAEKALTVATQKPAEHLEG
ncbi:MAG: KEOPS complex subunit Pcc1 [Candidatus Bathyarchaeota archaeon]|nr:KEOPS complex subunit Pcc1 [Candidatus Bathyarchaeota archaeon]